MPAGEAFSPGQLRDIERAVGNAETSSGLRFSVYVGADAAANPRKRARDLHAQLDEPARSVLVYVDPEARVLEIVTGSAARDQLRDGRAGLSALAMQQSFAAGQLAQGLVNGLQQLGEQARTLPVRHADADLELGS